MKRIAERQVEQLLKRRIEKEIPGAKCLKFVSPGCTGVPDRIVLLPGGAALFVELKRPGEKPRPRQRYVHGLIRRLGFPVFGCVDAPEAVEEVLALCRHLVGGAGTVGQVQGGQADAGIQAP